VSGFVHAYHDGTKHHFHRFARSLGYLDWASQPNPFRSFAGTAVVPLPPRPEASVESADRRLRSVIGHVLRHALGLSAWKQLGASRWALRVNPSSGNLHPTEAYVIAGAAEGLSDAPGVYHYAPDRHALERRCTFDSAAWPPGVMADIWLIALTSIHWREAWKYGERAFRYCQHDMGHAIAALRIAASTCGCSATLLPEWSHADIAALTGLDRDDDFFEAEREEAGCLVLVSREWSVVSTESSVGSRVVSRVVDREALLTGVHAGQWAGRASQLSEDHTTWSFIDEIAAATEDPGRAPRTVSAPPTAVPRPADPAHPGYPAHLILQRRSAVAFDGVSAIGASTFFTVLSRTMPQAAAPWDALWWPARVHLALFVHRVDDVAPGLYLLARDPSAIGRLRASCTRDFLWEPVGDRLSLFLLARGDARSTARRLSCDQAIASDGFFSLGMLAEFDASLETFGPSFYRHLFWETGFIGQVLYLEAEAAGARATGIGCFFDDPVHEMLGITDHSFQSLYHFTVGTPVDDTRLTTEPGYAWEAGARR
jgi:SagB-type dehydrogenase family enzyme